METLYEKASLILNPGVYDSGKVYATKPFDGSGDLTFTRASNATRVASNGLIEKVRTNLLTYSNTFSNAAWQVVGAPTLTANYDTNPLTGANDAWRFQSASVFDRIFQSFSGSFHTASLYAKGTGTLRVRDSVGTYTSDLVLTSSWQRVSLIIPASFSNVQITSNGGCDATIYAAQLETGDIATDYIATTATAVSVGPVSGLPRLDYLNSSCPRLLLEPQRTNVCLWSENFDNAGWNKQAGTVVTANQTISPDGTQNADLIVGTGNGILISDLIVPSASANTKSVYLKGVSGGEVVLLQDPNQTIGNTICNLTTSWQRFTLTETQTGGFGGLWIAGIPAGGIYAWGAQVEVGAYATSYIPTLGTSVTRVADAAFKTGISSLIGQTEGTLFFDFVATAQNADGAGFSVITTFGDSTDNFQLYAIGTALYWYAWKTGVLIDQTATQTLVAGDRYKVAYAYKSGDWALYINGVQKRTNTTAAVPAVSQFNLSASGLGVSPVSAKNEYNQILFFKTRLTNAQLAELTTL
jgi:hypothetical protein